MRRPARAVEVIPNKTCGQYGKQHGKFADDFCRYPCPWMKGKCVKLSHVDTVGILIRSKHDFFVQGKYSMGKNKNCMFLLLK